MVDTAFKRHEPLYLKYRPQSLSQLVGQEAVTRTLTNAIEHDRLSHAYLFTGPRGTGKTSSARILAKSLNCKSTGRPVAEPCQTCSCCLEITLGNSPAVFEIDAASNNSVDDARALIERAPLQAVGGEFKVNIIDECHLLTKEAFNALLKTIEQPPPGVVFILATTEEHKVLPTIISRCQRLMFRLINQDDLFVHLRHVADLEQIAIEDDALKLIARRSGGGLRDALSNLDQASLLASPEQPANVADLLRLLGALHEDVLLSISNQISNRQGQEVIQSVGQLLGEGREPAVVLQELSRHFLNLMKATYLKGSKTANFETLSSFVLGSEGYINGLLSQVDLFERAELSQIVEQLDRLEGSCKRTSQPAMHLEIGLLSICHRHDIHQVSDLLKRIEQLEEFARGNQQFAGAASGTSRPAPGPAPSPQVHGQVRPKQDAAARPSSSQPSSQHAAPPHAVSASSETRSVRPETDHPDASLPAAPTRSDDSDSGTRGGEAISISILQPPPSAESAPTAPASVDSSSAVPAPSGGGEERLAEFNSDLDYTWQQILDELQRRHLPTFSLASTQAFPLGISSVELTVGVLKDNLQKMMETKAEHLRVACLQVTGLNLAVKIRVSEQTTPAPSARKSVAATRAPQSRDESGQQNSSQNYSQNSSSANNSASSYTDAQEPSAQQDRGRAELEPNENESNNQRSGDEVDTTMVKEAYKLFEGPGSRRIQ